MLKKLITPYKGLSREVWFLALTTLVNRAGAMVIPFLSLYLTRSLGFTMGQVGWIMTCYGIGSVLGVFLGGKFSDRIGYYKVMLGSLSLTGLIFLSLQVVETFYGFCLGIFMLTLVADAFRAYAYFRWVDDQLDQPDALRVNRLGFLEQQKIIQLYYTKKKLKNLWIIYIKNNELGLVRKNLKIIE